MSTVYEIGPFRLDPAAGVLSHRGRPLGLGARAVAVLATLVERPSEYVRKERILESAWSGVVVEEGNLPVQIAAIRRALAQTPGGERWVETLARRGYRFVGPVTKIEEGESAGIVGGRERSNLSAALTSFIGRERELVEIKRLLSGKRLLTIVGIGGIGKTRLALQVAAEVMEAYQGGVWLVELGSITDPSLVPTAVARILEVREVPGTPLTQTLCECLKARQLLLILDNCEHLLNACAALANALLRSAAQPTILATSREPLQVDGEQTYPLQSLSLPESSGSVQQVAYSDAGQLFVERARLQLPDFELTQVRAPWVANLCIHLDGIPLALELAAARVRSLSIEQISERLSDRFNLLTGGSRTALPRQQTLRATIDWSYDLLCETERALLRRLSIFVDGFSLEAAAAVGSLHAIDVGRVTDLLAQLVARSLVVADTGDTGARYRLLETMRAYALAKLDEAAETRDIQRRHAEYFCELFENAPCAWLHLPDSHWRSVYLPELGNVRAALDWSSSLSGDPPTFIALAGASAAVWAELSLQREGSVRLASATASIDDETATPDQARLWLWLGLLRAKESPTEALNAFEHAVDLYRRHGDQLGLGYALLRLGGRLTVLRRFDEAEHALADAHPLIESARVPKLLGDYHAAFGFLKSLSEDRVTAREHFERAVALYRACEGAGSEERVLNILGNLADLNWALGDLDAALAGFREASVLLRRVPLAEKRFLGTLLVNLAGVHTERGELDDALATAREGLPMLQEAGCAWSALEYLALRVMLAGDAASAAHIAGYQDAILSAKGTPRQPTQLRARHRLQALLNGELAADEVERILAEGASMSEDDVCRLATDA